MRPHSFVNDQQSPCPQQQQQPHQTSPPNLKHYSNLRVNENRWSRRPSSSTPTNTPLYSPTNYAPNYTNIDQQYCKVISEYKSGLASSNFTRGNYLSQSLMISSSGAARKPPLPPSQMSSGGRHTVNNSPHLSRIMGSSYYVSPPPCGWKTVGNVVTVKRSTSVTGSLRQTDSQDRFMCGNEGSHQKKHQTAQLNSSVSSGRKWTAPFHCLLKKDGSSHNSRLVSAKNDGVVGHQHQQQQVRKERKQRTAISPAEKITSARTSLFKKKSHHTTANQEPNPIHYSHGHNHHHGSMSRGIKKSISLLFSPRSTRNSKSDLSTPINSEKSIKSGSKHSNTASTISISAACKHQQSKQHKSSEEILMISSKSCDDDDDDDVYRSNYGNNSMLGSVTPSVSLRSSVSQPMGGWAVSNAAGNSMYEKGMYDDDDDEASEDDEEDGHGTCVEMSSNYRYMSVNELEQSYHPHHSQSYQNSQRSQQSSQYDLVHADMVSSYHSTYSTNSSLITSNTPMIVSNNNNRSGTTNNNYNTNNNNPNITCCVPGNMKRFPGNNNSNHHQQQQPQISSFQCPTPTLHHSSPQPSYPQSITPTSSSNLPIPPPHLSSHNRQHYPHQQSRPFITHYHHYQHTNNNTQDNNCVTPTQQHSLQNNWKTIVGNVCRSNSKDSAIANSSVSTEMGILGQSQRASLISSGGTSEDFHNDQDSSYSSLSDVRSSNSFHHYYHHHSRTSNNQLPPVTDEKSSSSSSPPTTAMSEQQGSSKSNEISPSTSSDISTGTLRPIGKKQTHLSRSVPTLTNLFSPHHLLTYTKRIRSYSNLHRDVKSTKVVSFPRKSSMNKPKTQVSQYPRLQTIPTDIESLITSNKFVSMKSSGLTNSPLLSQYSRLYSLRSTSNQPAISPAADLLWNSSSITHNNKSGKLNSPTTRIDLSNSPLKKLHQVIYDNNNQIQATNRKIRDFK